MQHFPNKKCGAHDNDMSSNIVAVHEMKRIRDVGKVSHQEVIFEDCIGINKS